MEFEELQVDEVYEELRLNLNIKEHETKFYHFCDQLEEFVKIINKYFVFDINTFIFFLSSVLKSKKLDKNLISNFFNFEDKDFPAEPEVKNLITNRIDTLRFLLQKATEDSIILD